MGSHAKYPMQREVMAWRRHRPQAAARLRSLREAAGLTQLELAARSGITHEAISTLERARRSPHAATLERLAAALEVAPDDLVAPRTDPVPDPAPSGRWLTVAEAAALLDRSDANVRVLLRAGRLRPAVRTQVNGRGHAQWLIDAAAAERFRAPRHRHPPRPVPAPPPDHLSLVAASAASGVPRTTLWRWVQAGIVPSVREGRRHWLPAAAVAQLHRDPADARDT